MTPIKSFTRLVNKILGKESTYSQQDMIVVDKALTELEELKRDVKRYFELVEKTMSYVILGREDECDEVERLKDKLLKVGKEE